MNAALVILKRRRDRKTAGKMEQQEEELCYGFSMCCMYMNCSHLLPHVCALLISFSVLHGREEAAWKLLEIFPLPHSSFMFTFCVQDFLPFYPCEKFCLIFKTTGAAVDDAIWYPDCKTPRSTFLIFDFGPIKQIDWTCIDFFSHLSQIGPMFPSP